MVESLPSSRDGVCCWSDGLVPSPEYMYADGDNGRDLSVEPIAIWVFCGWQLRPALVTTLRLLLVRLLVQLLPAIDNLPYPLLDSALVYGNADILRFTYWSRPKKSGSNLHACSFVCFCLGRHAIRLTGMLLHILFPAWSRKLMFS